MYVDSAGCIKSNAKTWLSILCSACILPKPVTSVAVLQLVEKGLVDLDAPIGEYIEELNGLEDISIGQ